MLILDWDFTEGDCCLSVEGRGILVDFVLIVAEGGELGVTVNPGTTVDFGAEDGAGG